MIAERFIGRYVIVRCTQAGVHAGKLMELEGRSCVLEDSRRLWYWKPSQGAFLSAAARWGLDESSKLGTPRTILLTEDCEISLCSEEAENSIRALPDYDPEV